MMFHVERYKTIRAIKGILLISLILFVFVSCFRINKNTEIGDYRILDSESVPVSQTPKPAVFLFENSKALRSFHHFLADKYNVNENRDFPVTIQNQKFTLSILDKSEIEVYITAEDLLLRRHQPNIVKTGDRQNYIAIQVRDNSGSDCLKTDSIFHNMVVNYLKELKIEYAKS